MSLPTFQRAAAGNREAQAEMVQRCLRAVGGPNTDEALCSAGIWARVVATHGHPSDHFILVGVLATQYGRAVKAREMSRARVIEAEIISLLTDLAAAGNEDAVAQLQTVKRGTSPEALAIADAMRRDVEYLSHSKLTQQFAPQEGQLAH